MEPPQSKPVRRRRRWLVIAIALLALISLGTWTLWPRVDPRLVGEWRMVLEPGSAPEEFTLRVRANGRVDHAQLPYTGSGTLAKGAVLVPGGSLWLEITGDQFELRNEGAEGLMQLYYTLKSLIRGRRPEVVSQARLVSVDAERLVLEYEERGRLELRRVPDGTLERESGK
jgi:hypothetical protein